MRVDHCKCVGWQCVSGRVMIGDNHVQSFFFCIRDNFEVPGSAIDRDQQCRSCLSYFIDEIIFQTIAVVYPVRYPIADIEPQIVFEKEKECRG